MAIISLDNAATGFMAEARNDRAELENHARNIHETFLSAIELQNRSLPHIHPFDGQKESPRNNTGTADNSPRPFLRANP
jgi:hypothetical protein